MRHRRGWCRPGFSGCHGRGSGGRFGRPRRSSLHGLALEHRADAEADPSAVGREKGFAAALFPDRRGQHLTERPQEDLAFACLLGHVRERLSVRRQRHHRSGCRIACLEPPALRQRLDEQLRQRRRRVSTGDRGRGQPAESETGGKGTRRQQQHGPARGAWPGRRGRGLLLEMLDSAARRRYRARAAADPSRGSGAAAAGSRGVRRRQRRPVRLALENRGDGVRDRRRPRTPGAPSASRRARSRTPRCRRACRPLVPRACSGLMYAAVPSMTPSLVSTRERRRECDDAGLSRRPSRSLRETEVEHLDLALGRDLDVRRLQIAMDDATLVGGVERVGNLPASLSASAVTACRDAVGRASRLRRARGRVRERRRRRHAVDRTRCADGSAPRAAAPRARTAPAAPAAGNLGRQDLDGDIAAEPGVVGAIDLAHAATPQQRDDGVAADVTSPQIGHRCRTVYWQRQPASEPRSLRAARRNRRMIPCNGQRD